MNYLNKKVFSLCRRLRNYIDRFRLTNRDFTIISQNCIGTLIYHDLNQVYNSPTINLFFTAEDFVKFVENLDYYLNLELTFNEQSNLKYPLGILDDIEIHFVHYQSKEEARNKWNIRKMRVNYKNIFFIMTDRDGCTEELVNRFNNIPYKNKKIFTCKKFENIESAVYIKKYKKNNCVGMLTNVKSIFGKREYAESFDYVKWINSGDSIL